jgi:RHS repeat-associated protein
LWAAAYDARGRRVRKTWQDQTTEFFWNADQLIAEISPTGRLRIYIYADALAFTPCVFLDYDSIEADPATCRSYVVFSDQIGAPYLIEDESGQVVWRASIAPFGMAEVYAGARIEFNFRFPGHYDDAEIGLHYNRFRYFDPQLGRYLQSDPWGISGGHNLYAYPSNPLAVADVRGRGENECEGTTAAEEDKEGTGNSASEEESNNPLAGMSEEELQAHCRARANAIAGQMTNPRDQEGVTVAVAVLQTGDDPDTRRVIVTSSTDSGKLPPGCTTQDGETVENGGVVIRQRNSPPDEDGNVPQRVKVTEHDSGGASAEMVPEKSSYLDDDNTGEKGTDPYVKRSQDNPDGSTDHHAEQRAVTTADNNGEQVVAMAPSRPCCPGCQNALGDNLNTVPPDLQGN